MRLAFSKYLVIFLTGIIIQIVVIVAVLIQTFVPANSLASSVYSIITTWTAALSIFRFITDWAGSLSACAVGLVFVALYADFRKHRRSRALNRLHNWTKKALLALAEYRQRDASPPDSALERYEEISALINKLKVNSRAVLADAQVLGGELDAKTKEAFQTLFAVDEKVAQQDESAFEDLIILRHHLAAVMISAFGSLQHERYTSLFVPKKKVGADD
jgi:hypothetical protein